MNNQILINELKTQILAILNVCDTEKMPTICQMRSTQQGKDSIVKDVVNRVLQGGSIMENLMAMENEFNNNKQEN